MAKVSRNPCPKIVIFEIWAANSGFFPKFSTPLSATLPEAYPETRAHRPVQMPAATTVNA